MANEALKVWTDLPADIRKKILANVFCPQCAHAVTMCDYNVSFDGGVLVLRGYCSVCGNKVARVLEESKEAPAKPTVSKKYALENYIFDVLIIRSSVCDLKEKVERKIQIAGTKSLYDFAKVITQAFGFQFDHCFGFYDNLSDIRKCKKAFELFVDAGEAPETEVTRGVKKTKIAQAFSHVGEKTLFLFDYGDEWRFYIELKEIEKVEKHDLKPVVLESIGKAPVQYPALEEETDNGERSEGKNKN